MPSTPSPVSFIALTTLVMYSLYSRTTTSLSPLPVNAASRIAARTRSIRGPAPTLAPPTPAAVAAAILSTSASSATAGPSSPSISISLGGSRPSAARCFLKNAARATTSVVTADSKVVHPRSAYGREFHWANIAPPCASSPSASAATAASACECCA